MNCQPDEEIINFAFDEGLVFEKDTVLFDTVFAGIGSTTRRIKVYNPSSNALKISNIQLGKGASSSYKLIINGTEAYFASDLIILGKDSLLILVEVLIDPKNEDTPYLVKDSIVFETNNMTQDVKLLAWGQEANYVGNVVLPCSSIWTAKRPYVLYGSVLLDTLCALTIEPGSRIYATKDAYLYVKGQMISKGTQDQAIEFSNDRLELPYQNIPGQWGGIVFLEGAHDCEITFTTIRNATFGIRLGSPDQDTIPEVVLRNVIIENMSHSGIINFTSDLYAENTLVNNCIQFVCANIAGGNYTYKHCTFANYSLHFIRQSPLFYASDNILLDDGSTIVEDIFVTIQNSIVHGDLEDELLFDFSGGADIQLAFNNSIFKTTISGLDTLGNILNQNPEFINPYQYDYRLDTLSPAKDSAANIGILIDLAGNARDELPDIGAYERIE
jgi:hypothetical protein